MVVGHSVLIGVGGLIDSSRINLKDGAPKIAPAIVVEIMENSRRFELSLRIGRGGVSGRRSRDRDGRRRLAGARDLSEGSARKNRKTAKPQ